MHTPFTGRRRPFTGFGSARGNGGESPSAAGKKRAVRRAAESAAKAAIAPFLLESLEQRQMLSDVVGPTTVTALSNGSSQYTLHLDNTGLTSPHHWTIQWGDGQQTTTSDSSSGTDTVTYLYAASSGSRVYNILATPSDSGAHPATTLGLDSSFASGAGWLVDSSNLTSGGARTVLIQPQRDPTTHQLNGTYKLLVAGNTQVGSQQEFTVARYNLDGTIDHTFGAVSGSAHTGYVTIGSASNYASALALDSQGRIVAVGANSSDQITIWRLSADGAVDTSFGSGGVVVQPHFSAHETATGVVVGSDNSIYVGGAIYDSSNSPVFAVAHYTVTGQLDTSWGLADPANPGLKTGYVTTSFSGNAAFATSMTLSSGGKLLLGGWALLSDGWNFGIAQYDTDGTLDTNFGPDHDGTVETGFDLAGNTGAQAIAVQSDGKIVAAGQADKWDGTQNVLRMAVARYLPDGTLDTSFGAPAQGDGQIETPYGAGDAVANAVVIQPDGKILVAGSSTQQTVSNPKTDFTLVRYNGADGSLDNTFGVNGVLTTSFAGSATVNGLALVPQSAGGGVIAVGQADDAGGTPYFALAKYLPSSPLLVNNYNSPPPTNLTATATAGGVALAWTAPSGGASGYNVYRSTTSGFTLNSTTRIASGIGGTSYTDVTADGATTYYYCVTAANVLESTPSNQPVVLTLPVGHDQVLDGGFEDPRVGYGNSAANPTGTPWTFAGTAGVAENGSSITSGGAAAPDGVNVAYLQGSASVSQSVNLEPGTYALTFMGMPQSGSSQTLQVWVGDQQVGDDLPLSGSSYAAYTTATFTIDADHAGPTTITIKGTGTLSSMGLIDSVSLLNYPSVPSPSSDYDGFGGGYLLWTSASSNESGFQIEYEDTNGEWDPDTQSFPFVSLLQVPAGVTSVSLNDLGAALGGVQDPEDYTYYIRALGTGSNSDLSGGIGFVQGPVTTAAASAAQDPVSGTSADLTVDATDSTPFVSDGSDLSFQWVVIGFPPGTVTFQDNGTTDNYDDQDVPQYTDTTDSTTATFSRAGVYHLRAIVSNSNGGVTTSDVTVTVNQTVTSLSVTPGTPTVANGSTQQFTASALDQFGQPVNDPATWTLVSGPGTLTSSGLYSAPPSATGTAVVRATVDGVSQNTSVTITGLHLLGDVALGSSSQPVVNLTWDGGSTVASSYVLQRQDLSDDSPTWATIATLPVSQQSFTDTLPEVSDAYAYRLIAGNSAPSNVVTAWAAPLVSAIGVDPTPAVGGSPVTLTATATPALSADALTLTYNWSILAPGGSTPTTYTTLTPSLTFTPATGGNWSATLTVTDATLSASNTTAARVFAVSNPPALLITGPSLVSKGASATYSVSGSAINDLSWTVNRDGTQVFSGSGSTLSFTPTEGGSYTVAVSGKDSESNSYSTSVNLSVAALAPQVTISGPAVGFTGKSQTFQANVVQSAGTNDPLSYQWRLLNADGSAYSGSSGTTPTSGTTFIVPASLPAETYQVSVDVTDTLDTSVPVTHQTFTFTLLPAPTAADFEWGSAPMENLPGSPGFIAEAMIREPDGKIIVGGRSSDFGNSESGFLIRFNADLTIDPTFGTDHSGIVKFGFSDDSPNNWPMDNPGLTDVFALAYNAKNGDVVVTGDTTYLDHGLGDGTSPSGLARVFVAEVTTANDVTAQGEMVPAGSMDPAFNGGREVVLGDQMTLSAGEVIHVLDDGSILIGGSVVTAGTPDTVSLIQDKWQNFGSTLPVPVDDFMLLKLTPTGQLDDSFGRLADNYQDLPTGHDRTGIAVQTEMTGLASYLPFTDSGQPKPIDEDAEVYYTGSTGIDNLIVTDDGKILAGGYIGRLALDSDGNLTGGGEGGVDYGFALARYNADGTLDTSFGPNLDGKTFTSSAVFDQTNDGFALLSTMTIVDGKIRAAGEAMPRTGWPGSPTVAPRVVLAQYSADGVLDTSYGDGGVIVTSETVPLEPDSGANSAFFGPYFPPAGPAFIYSFRPENVAMLFSDDGGQLIFSTLDPLTHASKLVALDSNDGSRDDSFGPSGTGEIDLPNSVSPQTPEMYFEPGMRAGTLLMSTTGTGDQKKIEVITAGALSDLDPPPYGSGLSLTAMPAVMRYTEAAQPAAGDLTATSTAPNSVALTWTSTGFGEDGYYVERSSTSSTSGFSIIAAVGPDQHDFVDGAVVADTTYYYQVVPYSDDATGQRQAGTATAPSQVHTLPASSGVLKETLLVPADGTLVTTNTVLQNGVTYILVARGSIHLNGDYTADAAHWYSTADANVHGDVFGDVRYGIGINSTAAAGSNAVPEWGLAQNGENTYSYAVVGDGHALSLQFHSASYAGDFVAPGDQPFSVQIYAVDNSTANPSTVVLPTADLKETLSVPANGTAVTSSTALHAGKRYLVVASGNVDMQSGPSWAPAVQQTDFRGDAAYWYTEPNDWHDSIIELQQYGIGINEATPTPSTVTVTDTVTNPDTGTFTYTSETAGRNGLGWLSTHLAITSNQDGTYNVTSTLGDGGSALYGWTGGEWVFISGDSSVQLYSAPVPVPPNEVPDWGQYQTTGHQYMYTVTGDDSALTFKLHVPSDALTSLADGQSLQVQIYEIDDQDATVDQTAGPVMRIVSPAPSSTTIPTVISTNTPVNIISAQADGTAAPWALWIVSSVGTRTLLASSNSSAGALPGTSYAAATIVPAQYANGTYTLELTDSVSDPASHVRDSRPIVIATPVKVGNLTLPITDAVLNTPAGQVSISRTYNSGRLDINDGFGPGWSFDLLDSQLTTTSQADTYNRTQSTAVLRAGDLVSFTVPDGGQRVFEFAPMPLSNVSRAVGSETSVEYVPRFIAVDGSGATLTLQGTGRAWGEDVGPLVPQRLAYDATDNEFIWTPNDLPPDVEDDTVDVGFTSTPQDRPFVDIDNWDYHLTNSDGSSYVIDPRTGLIQQATDASGNTTTYTVGSDGTITAKDSSGNTTLTINKNPGGQITSIVVPGQPAVLYSYDSNAPNANLISAQSQAGNVTHFSYQDSTFVHALTGVTNAQGKTVLQARYDSQTGQLLSLTNSSGATVPVSVKAIGNDLVSQTVADLNGDVTEDIFDEANGTLVRKIQTQSHVDSSGQTVIDGYVVTVSKFTYVTDDIAEMSALRASGVQVLQSVETYAPFIVSGSDPQGARYTEQPTADSWTKRVVFDTSDSPDDPAREQIISLSQRLDDGNRLQTTTFSNYAIVNATSELARPQLTTVDIETRDDSAPTGYDDQPKSQTYTSYNSNAQQQYSFTVVGPDLDPNMHGYYLAQGTINQFGTGSFSGLVTETDNATALISPTGAVQSITTLNAQSRNAYYDVSDYLAGTAGFAYGAVKYSFDAAGQETYYAYDSAGRTVLQYVWKTWTDDSGLLVSGWVGTTSVYDSVGRLTDTYQATYVDPNAANETSPHTLATIAGGMAGVDVDASHYVLDGTPLRTSHVDYNTVGQKVDSIDQYGGETDYTYDANGNLIRTVNPNGTETRSVYDAMGNVIWQTNTFVPANGDPTSLANTAVATHTIYDQLGRAIESDVYKDVVITISSARVGSVSASTSAAFVGGVSDPAAYPSADLISTSKTFYDPAGNKIETISPSGLRTGTIYNPDGSVAYTGPLADDAPDGGRSTLVNGVTTLAYLPSDFAYSTQTLSDQYDPTLQLFYTRSIDANGHHTDTYTDAEGRTVRTVYDDGSFTETLYSYGTNPVTTDAEGETIPTPTNAEGWDNIPTGGSEVVRIAQRKAGDPPVITYNLYDAAGRLTDVWQPAVIDADPTSPTYGLNPEDPAHYQVEVRPHTHYAYDTAGNETAQVTADEQADLNTWLNTPDEENPHTLANFPGDTQYGYDQYGNQVRQLLPDAVQTLSDGSTVDERPLSTVTYSVFGQQLISVDADGQTTAYTYDNTATGQGRLTGKFFFAAGVAATDSSGNVLTGSAAESSSYGYNAMGEESEVYDYVDGSLSRQVDITYDPITQQVASIASPEGVVHYTYDSVTGNLVETWTTNDRSEDDAVLTSGVVDGKFTEFWTGTSQASAGTDVRYGYDLQGRLSTVTQVRVNGQTPTLDRGTMLPTTTYTYDNAGNLVQESQSNSLFTTYVYDDLNRLTYLETDFPNNPNSGTGIVFIQSFDLNDDGTRKDSQEAQFDSHGLESSNVCYVWTYDADGRLTGESAAVDVGPFSSYQDTFAYDLVGNRMKEDVNGGDATDGGSTVHYTYNRDGELLTETETANAGGTATQVYQTTNTYDPAGNLTTSATTGQGASSSTYSYDVRNEMTGVTTTAGGSTSTTTYGYDDDGVRVSETTGSTAIYYLNDPSNPTGYAKAIQESSSLGGAPMRSYVLGLDVIAQSDAANGTLYLVHDGHGSTRQVLDADGTIVQVYDYDAWGKALDFDPSSAVTPWLFGGDGTYDASSGFTYQLARWRNGLYFTQRDAFQGLTRDPLSLHRYLYVEANPVRGHDYSGRILTEVGEGLNEEADELGADEGVIQEAEQVVDDVRVEQFDEMAEEADIEAEATEGHHTIPKQLAGMEDQELYDLEEGLHDELHSDLKYELDDEFHGEPGYPGINGSSEQWAEFFQANAGAQSRAYTVLEELYEALDAEWGTDLVGTLMQNLEAGNFIPFP